MDYTFYGAGLGQASQTSQASQNTSINISNNKAGAAQGVSASFENVIVSAGRDRKISNANTYKELLKETEDVKAQIMASATDAKANLKALFNRLSGADAVAINEDGFNLNDMSKDEMVSIIDKIKIELATYCEDYNVMPGDGISMDKLESVVGSQAGANAVAAKMSAANIALTQENIDEMASALERLKGITELSEDAKYLLLETDSDITIENMNMAKYAVGSQKLVYNGEKNQEVQQKSNRQKAGKKSEVDLKEEQWKELCGQVKDIIEAAGLEINDENMTNARRMFEKDIPITRKNLAKMHEINNLKLDIDTVVDKIVEKMADGGKAESADLTQKVDGMVKEVAKALNILDRLSNDELTRAAAGYAESKGELTLNSIEAALDYLSGLSENSQNTAEIKTADNGSYSVMQNSDAQMKILLEVQILMTAESGSFLVNKGININTTSILVLHEHLMAYDRETVMDTISEQLSHDIDEDTKEQMYERSLELRRALYTIKKTPMELIAKVISGSAAEYSIREFFGAAYSSDYKKAQMKYEASGTGIRSDYGDSLKKAVESSGEAMLSDMGMENNEPNREAVRILAANGIDVTKENVTLVKELNSTLKSVVDNMTPERALQLIRDNVNPMDADIHDVEQYLKKMDVHDENEKLDKYSTFLYKLDRTDGITKEEREQYIGIFKMMNMFTKDAGNAIGALLKADADITMYNLASAYTSVKHSGNDYRIDDETQVRVAATTNYYMNLFEQSGYAITPNTLKLVQSEKKINERSVEDFTSAANRLYDAKAEAAYMEEYMQLVRAVAQADSSIIAQLEHAEQSITINSIEAMQMLAGGDAYRSIFTEDTKKAESFIEKLDDRDALADEYEKLESESDRLTNDIIEDSKDMSYEYCRRVQLGNQAIHMACNMSRRNDYRIPVVNESGVGMMNLTLVSDTEENGRISVNYEASKWGNVSVEVKVSESRASITVHCQKNENDCENAMNELAGILKNEYSLEECTVYTNGAKQVHRVIYNEAKDNIPTKVLYRMSKTIVSTIIKMQ